MNSLTESIPSSLVAEPAPPEPEKNIVVNFENDNFRVAYDRRGEKFACYLITALVAWRLIWPLVERLALDPWLSLSLVAIAAAGSHFATSYLCKRWLSHVADKTADRKIQIKGGPISHWTISDYCITRHYPKHTESISINAITAVNHVSDQLQVTTRFNEMDCLPNSGFSSIDQRHEALAILSSGAAIESCSRLETEDTVELESCYSKASLKVLKAYQPNRNQAWKEQLQNNSFLILVYVGFRILDFLVNGGKMIGMSDLFLLALTMDPQLTFGRLFSKAAMMERHFWQVGVSGFRFGTRQGNAWQETFRQWSDLQEVVETDEGLILQFTAPSQTTLLPRRTVSLQTWQEAVYCIKELGGFPVQT